MRRVFVATVTVCAMCGACQEPTARLNAPPHGTATKVSELQSQYVSMADNALLADMTISDVHFIPHRARLNTLGEQRLCRLALLMEEYGGTIRFNTDLDDEKLIEARTNKILDFLAEAGVDTAAKVLARDLPGGKGLSANEAILIRAYEATYTPKTSQQQP